VDRVPADRVGFRADALRAVDAILEEGVATRAFPGAVAVVGRAGAIAHVARAGRLTYAADAAPVALETIYDLASLTKVLVTTTMAMMLVDDGLLDLERRVVSVIPAFTGAGKDDVTAALLLCHAGGLEWHAKLYLEAQGEDAVLERVLARPLAYPPGTRAVYSDLGFILLGAVLERIAGTTLIAFAQARIFGPLGMRDTGYRPPAALRPRIAPTEEDPWRGRLLWGEVHDENAFAMGGVAPHAGVFGTAADLAAFADAMRGGGALGETRLVSEQTLRLFTRPAGIPGDSHALGWDTPSGHSSAGELFSRRSFGHLGFTGTSLWVDPDHDLFLALLTNRVHPHRGNDGIRAVRRAAADAVIEALAT
jgi:CubicO group peptidase (beta-lactamase class C family)